MCFTGMSGHACIYNAVRSLRSAMPPDLALLACVDNDEIQELRPKQPPGQAGYSGFYVLRAVQTDIRTCRMRYVRT